jgi:pilus assembly protein Flp/PilA
MKTFLKTFLADESGASAAEYALILAVVGVAIGGAALLLADTIQDAIGESAVRVDACAENAADPDADNADCEAAELGDFQEAPAP